MRGIVPVVDVGALVAELGPEANVEAPLSGAAMEAVDQLDEACRRGSAGIIAVNHGFSAELEAAMEAAKKWHGADRRVKDRLRPGLYDPPGQVRIAIRPATLHERLSYPRVVSGDETVAGSVREDAPPLYEGLDVEMDVAMRAYQKRLRGLALALLRGMATKLGIPRRHFDRGWALSNSGLTSLHYLELGADSDAPRRDGFTGHATRDVDDGVECGADPRVAANGDGIGDLGATLRAYPHADGDTLLTLLCHDRVEGLQVLLRAAAIEDDEWVDVPAVAADQVVVQIGQMTQRLTNDEYKATPHRVLLPPAPAPARTTLSMFYRPGLASLIEVPPSLRRPNDAGMIYETLSVADFLQLPRTDADGNAVALSANILKDGRWVGARPGAHRVPNVA